MGKDESLFCSRLQPFQINKMEKKVESPTSLAAAAGVSKESSESGAPSSCSPTSEGLELARMFQQLSVTRPGCSHGKWRESSHSSSTDKQPLKRLKKYDKFKPEKKLSFRRSSQKFTLKPSRLSCTDRSSSSPKSSLSNNPSEVQSDNFSEFLNACSREIATIEESEQQKQRKSSTCAQQAREEHDHSAVNFSIDVLTDYLEETVLLPKKMSYMAELMYT